MLESHETQEGSMNTSNIAPTVTEKSTQGAEARISLAQIHNLRTRWTWVEASIWTDNMLTALATGSKEVL